MRLFLLLILIPLTGCADVMLLSSSYGIVGSSNTYVKAYNTIDVVSLATTKKDIKEHALNKIKKKKEPQPLATLNELQLITQHLVNLTVLHQEVNLKLDQLTIQVELNQEDIDTRLIDLETNKLVAFYKKKYANLIAMHQKSKSYKSPRQLAVVLQNKLKKEKEVD
tara:strand:- start:295 stop:792 length:498 start_codon:yes stop_codon:yes gene_type:complete